MWNASDSSVDTPTTGIPSAWPSALAVAMPMRRPVNVPGPIPTATRSICATDVPDRPSTSAISGSRQAVCRGRPPAGGSSRAPSGSSEAADCQATAVARVAVSKARSGIRLPTRRGRQRASQSKLRMWPLRDLHYPPVTAGVLDVNAASDAPQLGVLGRTCWGPLDERDLVRSEIVGKQVGLLLGHAIDSKQIDVRNGHVRRIQLSDRERGAGHWDGDPELPTRSAHQRGLPRAELSRDEHDIAGAQPPGDTRSHRFGLGWGVRLHAVHSQLAAALRCENFPAHRHLNRL